VTATLANESGDTHKQIGLIMSKSISIERRGKFGGVKAHLDPDICQILLAGIEVPGGEMAFTSVGRKLAFMIQGLLEDEPDLLSARSQAQIDAELHEEMIKAQMKLARGKAGGKWDEPPQDPLLLVFADGKIQLIYKKSFAEYASWSECVAECLLPHGPIHVRLIC